MRLVAVIALGVFAAGAVITGTTDWTIAGTEGDTVGALLMVVAGVVLLFLVLVPASRSPVGRTGALEADAIEESDDQLSAGWPRR